MLFSCSFSPFYGLNIISFFIYFLNWKEAEYFSKLIVLLIFDAKKKLHYVNKNYMLSVNNVYDRNKCQGKVSQEACLVLIPYLV